MRIATKELLDLKTRWEGVLDSSASSTVDSRMGIVRRLIHAFAG